MTEVLKVLRDPIVIGVAIACAGVLIAACEVCIVCLLCNRSVWMLFHLGCVYIAIHKNYTLVESFSSSMLSPLCTETDRRHVERREQEQKATGPMVCHQIQAWRLL